MTDVIGDWLQPADAVIWLNGLDEYGLTPGPPNTGSLVVFSNWTSAYFNDTTDGTGADVSFREFEAARRGVNTDPTVYPPVLPSTPIQDPDTGWASSGDSGVDLLTTMSYKAQTGPGSPSSHWRYNIGGAGFDFSWIRANIDAFANMAALPTPDPPAGTASWDVEWEDGIAEYVRTEVQVEFGVGAAATGAGARNYPTMLEWYIQPPGDFDFPPDYGFTYGPDPGAGTDAAAYTIAHTDPNNVLSAGELLTVMSSDSVTDWITLSEDTIISGLAAQAVLNDKLAGLSFSAGAFVPTLQFVGVPTIARHGDWPGLDTEFTDVENGFPFFGTSGHLEDAYGGTGLFWCRIFYTPARMRYVYHLEFPPQDITGELTSVRASFDP